MIVTKKMKPMVTNITTKVSGTEGTFEAFSDASRWLSENEVGGYSEEFSFIGFASLSYKC